MSLSTAAKVRTVGSGYGDATAPAPTTHGQHMQRAHGAPCAAAGGCPQNQFSRSTAVDQATEFGSAPTLGCQSAASVRGGCEIHRSQMIFKLG